jgi:hypothetical protein
VALRIWKKPKNLGGAKFLRLIQIRLVTLSLEDSRPLVNREKSPIFSLTNPLLTDNRLASIQVASTLTISDGLSIRCFTTEIENCCHVIAETDHSPDVNGAGTPFSVQRCPAS